MYTKTWCCLVWPQIIEMNICHKVWPGMFRPNNLVLLRYSDMLHFCDAWQTVIVIRSDVVKQISGGLAQIWRNLCRIMFSGPYDLRSGVVLPGMEQALRASISVAISDEPALKHLFGCKGSSGLFCCMCCANAVQESSELDSHSHCVVSIVEHRLDMFTPHTDQTIYDSVDYIKSQRGRMGKGAFASLQKHLGFNDLEDGFLLAQDLRTVVGAASILHYDWMHVCLVQGTFVHEVAWSIFLALPVCFAGKKLFHLHWTHPNWHLFS